MMEPSAPVIEQPDDTRQAKMLRQERRAARFAVLWAALLVMLTAGYFQNSRPGWNVKSQLALTCAIVERHTLAIDAYQKPGSPFETEDKAFYAGHYYCDKSPVTPFLGVPVFFVYRALTKGLGGALGFDFSYHTARYLITWWTAGLSAAILAGLTAWLLMRRGVATRRAALAAALWVAATPLLGYAILFFNYLPACAMALGGFACVERIWREGREAPAWRLALGGLLLGLATWTLNTMAVAALAITLVLLAAPAGVDGRGERAGGFWVVRMRRLWPWALGGLIGGAGQFIYTWSVFHTLKSPYAYEADPFFREQMARGLMGATQPRALVAWLVTLHPLRPNRRNDQHAFGRWRDFHMNSVH